MATKDPSRAFRRKVAQAEAARERHTIAPMSDQVPSTPEDQRPTVAPRRRTEAPAVRTRAERDDEAKRRELPGTLHDGSGRARRRLGAGCGHVMPGHPEFDIGAIAEGAGARPEIVAGATDLFDEPGALDKVARSAANCFAHHLAAAPAPAPPRSQP